jgi:hypothetical protein
MKKAAIIATSIWGLVVLCLLIYLALERPSAPGLPSRPEAPGPGNGAARPFENHPPTAAFKSPAAARESPAGATYFDIKGNLAFPGWMIESAMQLPPDIGADEALALVQEAVRRFYLAYGYINVEVFCQLASDDPPLFEMQITEGKRFVWEDLQIESKSLPAENLRRFFAVEKGHAVNMLEHVKSLADLADAFQEQGYLTFSYVPTITADEDRGTFSTKINVKEGPRYILADVSLNLPDAGKVMNDLIGRPCNMFEISRRLTRLGLVMGDVRIERNAERGEVYIRSKSN